MMFEIFVKSAVINVILFVIVYVWKEKPRLMKGYRKSAWFQYWSYVTDLSILVGIIWGIVIW